MRLGFQNSKTNFLSVSGILLLFCFQQFILYYSIYYLKKVKIVLYALIIDIPIGLYILLGLLVRSLVSSVRYSILWCMYSVTVVVKMFLLTFLDKCKRHVPLEGVSCDSNDMLLSFFGLYLTPIVFSLFNNASKSSLFRDENILSLDELLHSDLGLSTTIDLWDLILMFSHLLKYYKVEVREGKHLILKAKLFVVFIIFVLTTIFLLGLVIPAVDGDYKVEDRFKTNIFNEAVRLFIKFVKMFSRTKSFECKRASEALSDTTNLKSVNENAGSLDMYTMAKFTFIIGFFLVDIPFLCYRLYILVKYNVFSLLLYKNFIFLFLRPYRLNMSQLAERDTAKGVQTAFLNTDLLGVARDKRADRARGVEERNHKSVTFNVFDDSESDSDMHLLKRYSRKSSMRRRWTKPFKSSFIPKLLTRLSFSQPRPYTKSDPMHLSSKLFNTPFNSKLAANVGGRAHGNAADGPSRVSLFRRSSGRDNECTKKDGIAKHGSLDSLEYLVGEPGHVEHPYKMYVVNVLKRSKLLPIRSFPISVVLGHFYRFIFSRFRRFECTLFANIGGFARPKFTQIVFLVAFLFSVAPRVLLVVAYYLFELRSPRDIVTNFTTDASFTEKLILHVCIAFSFVAFIMFLFSCKVYDSIFSFARDLLNLYSIMVCLHCLKSVLRQYAMSWILFIFLFHPVSMVISLLMSAMSLSTTTETPSVSEGTDGIFGRHIDYDGKVVPYNARPDDKSACVATENVNNRVLSTEAKSFDNITHVVVKGSGDTSSNGNSNIINTLNAPDDNSGIRSIYPVDDAAASGVTGKAGVTEKNSGGAGSAFNLIGNFDSHYKPIHDRIGNLVDSDCLLNRKATKIQIINLEMIYILLKYSMGPVTLNHRLCSLDMVQMLKIHDSLLYSQWSNFFYSFFFRILCCFSLDSKSSTIVLLVDLLFFFLYNAMGQSVRSLMFRKHEVNFIVMRLLGILRFDWDHRDAKAETSVTFADVDKYIKSQGLFSSPGIIIPPFI